MPVSQSQFTMEFNFKLVYTDIVHTIQINSHATLYDLFKKADELFAPHIDYTRFETYYVVAGQSQDELAPAISDLHSDHPLYYEFGERWKHVSFYVRPCDIHTHTFTYMTNYNTLTQT